MANVISITMENFRSYKNKSTFSFEAVDSDKKKENFHKVNLENGEEIKLLNTAVIYGANAVGKSNVITALLALSSFIRNTKRYDPEDKITYEPYLFSNKTSQAPIFLSIKFVVNQAVYEYGITYNRTTFISEELALVGTDNYVFKRNIDGVVFFNTTYISDLAEEKVLPNHLALSDFSLKADNLIQSIYRELSSIKAIPLTDEYQLGDNSKEAARLLHDEPDGEFTSMIKNIITAADTGIVDVVIEELDDKKFHFPSSFSESLKSRIISQNKYQINMVHPTEEGSVENLPLSAESAGTKTLFTAGARVLKALQDGGLIAYDEMNIALHPMLFRRLVELFNNDKTNPYHAQLLVTTHDATLLEDNLLRADQIWFVEKKDGVSDLFSAIDFDGVTIDQPFEGWYRAGRLGGQPHLRPFLTDFAVSNM